MPWPCPSPRPMGRHKIWGLTVSLRASRRLSVSWFPAGWKGGHCGAIVDRSALIEPPCWESGSWTAPDATLGPSWDGCDGAPRRVKASENPGCSSSSCVPRLDADADGAETRAPIEASLPQKKLCGKTMLPEHRRSRYDRAPPQLQIRKRDELQRWRSVRPSCSGCVCLCCGTLAGGRSRASQRSQPPTGEVPCLGPQPRSTKL